MSAVSDLIRTKLDYRSFADRPVSWEDKLAVLEAGRMAGTGMNTQHWRFILVDDKGDLAKLADYSITGKWVKDAAFAVVVLTNPTYPWHLLDAGRAITNMMLDAWGRGIISCICTSYDEKAIKTLLGVPAEYAVAGFIGFGYPPRRIIGRKKRLPLEQVAYYGRFGGPIRR